MADLYAVQNIHSFFDRVDFIAIEICCPLFELRKVQIGLPYHWGSKGLSRGDTANELISFVADPDVSIQEAKAFTGDIRPGRRSSHKRVVTSGPFAAGASNGNRRDLPAVDRKKVLSHGVRASKVIKE